MVCGIEARSFKYDPYRRIYFAQGLFVALRAAGERGIAEGLLAIELHTTIFTPIGIDGHRIPSPYSYCQFTKRDYSALEKR
jgi:hypothetical protein